MWCSANCFRTQIQWKTFQEIIALAARIGVSQFLIKNISIFKKKDNLRMLLSDGTFHICDNFLLP